MRNVSKRIGNTQMTLMNDRFVNKWENVPLIDVVDIFDSLRKPVNSKERQTRILGKSHAELYPYYGATGQAGFIDEYILDGEYVLLGEDGAPFLDSFADKAYMISGKTWVNNHVHILRSKTNNKFLCYYLNYFNYRGYVSGTTRLKLTQADMKKIPIPVPPLSVQECTVSRIEEMFSELEKAVEYLQTIKQQLKVYRQGVLKEAFEGVIEQNKQKQYWSIEEIAKVETGATPSTSKQEYYRGCIPWITSSSLNNKFITEASKYITELAIQETNCKIFEPHTIVVAMYGEGQTRGKCSELLIRAATNQAIAAISIHDTNIINKSYLKWYLTFNYNNLRGKASGGVQPNLNLSTIKDFKVPCAPISMQNKVVSMINEQMDTSSSVQNKVDDVLRQSECMKKSILKAAFEGKF